jgi:hypothetical protein
MAGFDGLSDDDLAAELERRQNKPARKVRVKGRGDDGSEYEFELEGDEAARVIARHSGLFAAPKADDDKKTAPGKPHLIPRKTAAS